MIIFLPIKLKRTGGSSSFARKFQTGMRENGHAVVFAFQRAFDVLLVNAQCPLRYLLYAKIKGIPIVHRLDGIYYPMTVAKRNYKWMNMPIFIVYRFFADCVVWQSKYSEYCVKKFIGKSRKAKEKLIYNGVDIKKFTPNKKELITLKDNDRQIVFITASRFRRIDQILPMIKALSVYRMKWNKNCKLVVVGDFTEQLSSELQNKLIRQRAKVVSFVGPIENADLPKYLRSSSVFLFTHLNPPCPNNVLEAMACGLPICGINDGAMSELTIPGVNSELLTVSDEGFFKPRNISYSALADIMAKVVENRVSYGKASRRICEERCALTGMIDEYIKVFKEAVNV